MTSKMAKCWAAAMQTQAFHRATGLLLSVAAVVSILTNFWPVGRDPIVVVRECGRNEFYRGEAEEIPLTGDAVESFTKGFVRLWLTRERGGTEVASGGISCVTTEGLGGRLRNSAGREAGRRKGKSFSQYVGKVEVELKEGFTLVTFDRIVSMGKVPVASRERVRLHIIRGRRAPCNPLGLYVNGIKEL